jgi:sugar O-acyltransferase (sialic acid O-acetyltransferase NeuD family)
MATGVAAMKPLIIFGSAEMAVLARFYFENDTDYRVHAFTVDDGFVDRDSIEGKPLVAWSEATRRFPPDACDMHVALSYRGINRQRQGKFEMAKAAGFRLVSYVCSKSATWPDLAIGENCFILENQTIQPTVKIGNNVMLWSGNHIGHGSMIGDHTYVASHVVMSGHCRIGQRCFLGVNATIRDFIEIGDDSFITMDASVTRNVPAGAVVLGAAGETYLEDDRRARTLKSRYFGSMD